jgi:hypothetical protein
VRFTEHDVANFGMDLSRCEVAQSRERFEEGVANRSELKTAQDSLARARHLFQQPQGG